MRKVYAIAKREIKASLVTPLAYALVAGMMVLSAFFFFSLLQQFNTLLLQTTMMKNIAPNLNQWVVVPFYQSIEVILVFLIPILTMRSLSEERRSGVYELLATSPLTSAELILGKFFGVAFTVLLVLLAVLVFPLVLFLYASPELPPILIGFLGIVLFALAYTAIGIAISACTKSQTIAGVLSVVVMLVLYIIDAPASKLGGLPGQVLEYLAPSSHTQALAKGLLTGGDLVYFLSLILAGLFFANRVLDQERWR